MLFAKRDLSDQAENSLSKRFTMRFGRYLGNPSMDETESREDVIDIDACYSLLGETSDEAQTTSELPRIINRIITAYEKQTGRWLEPEQVVLAAIRYDIKNQANILQHHFSKHLSPHSELHCSSKTSFLRLALLTDALGLNQFSTPHSIPCLSQLPSCKRVLNIPLDDISMQEIEANGRELRERCAKTLERNGINPEALQSCWRLRMRYAHSQTSLLLKCMPIEMMREVFQAQHKTQFGFAIQEDPILIEALEIEVKLDTPCQPGVSSENIYVDLLMSQWEAASGTTGVWKRIKDENNTLPEHLSFLDCSILKDLLTIYIAKPADLAMENFFIKNLKKEVDEAALHN